MRPEKLLSIKSSPCETATGELRCDLLQEENTFLLRCAYKFGFSEHPNPAKPVIRWKIKLEPEQVNRKRQGGCVLCNGAAAVRMRA